MRKYLQPFILCLIISNASLSEAEEIRVAAASSMTFALQEIAEQFAAKTDHQLKISYGSSGQLTRQIIQGAPFEVFLSANAQYVDRLSPDQISKNGRMDFASGELVLFVPQGSALSDSVTFKTLSVQYIAEEKFRFALADPAHAPYGVIAKQAMQSANIWNKMSPFLVLGANASQAAQFAWRGVVAAALLPRALALNLHKTGRIISVPQKFYTPLQHQMVLLNQAKKAARSFYDFMKNDQAQKILLRHGFTPIHN